tara:strand:- start:9318 stop:11021 length:1704 start_codon:yes stop_codon:yes gene_type:complete
MINRNTTPSKKKNDWFVIFYVFFVFFCIGYLSILALTWSWFSVWGSFQDHLVHILTLAKISQLPSYIEFLNNESLLLDLYLHTTLPAVLALIFSFWIIRKYLYLRGGKTSEILMNGPRLLTTSNEIQKLSKRQLENENSEQGIYLHPAVQVSKFREKRNIGLFGMPGSGKSVIVKYLLSQIDKAQEHMFIFDEKKEYTEILFDDRSVLIAPWDSRSMRWGAAKDLDTESQIHNFAHMIVADKDKPFWHQSAVELFTALVISLQDNKDSWMWRDFIKLTTLDDSELKALLSEYRPSLARFMQEGNETSGNVMMNLLSNIGWIQQLANIEDPDAEPFSIKEYLSGDTSTTKVIVQSDNRYRSLSAPYFSALFSIYCTEYLSNGGINDSPSWLILDEMGQIPPTDLLHEWLSTSREYEGRTIIGTQSVHQIYELYGKDKANTILSMCGNLICLAASSAGEDADFFSKALGEQIVERPSINSKNQDSVTTWQKDKKAVVEANDLINLPAPNSKGVSGYLYINGYNSVFNLTWSYPDLKKIAERSIERKQIKKTSSASSTPERIKRRRASKC